VSERSRRCFGDEKKALLAKLLKTGCLPSVETEKWNSGGEFKDSNLKFEI